MLNPTTIEMKKDGDRYKVSLHHYDMSQSWCFNYLLAACVKRDELLKEHPKAFVIEL